MLVEAIRSSCRGGAPATGGGVLDCLRTALDGTAESLAYSSHGRQSPVL